MLSGKDEFWKLVQEGREGHNIGLSIGSQKLETYMDGYLPGTSYLIGAASGTGKSTFVLEKFIYNPLKDYLLGNNTERDPYWIMFSLEMTRAQVYAKLISMFIWDMFSEQIRFKEMFSRGKNCILSDDRYSLMNCPEVNDYLETLDQRLYFYEGSLTEPVYLKVLNSQLKRFGTFKDELFIPNNPSQIVGVVVDHMSLIKASSGRSKKDEMDAISRDSVLLRNTTKIMSPIHVAQFNRSSNSDERLKAQLQEPDSSDFKDSGSLYEDSQVVLALFSPHARKLSTFHDFNIKVLEQSFIACFLLKSRFGTSNIIVPYGFYGDCSRYYDLPTADQIGDFNIYKDPYWVNTQRSEAQTNNVVSLTL